MPYSTQFINTDLAASTPVTYTVPTGFVAVVRDIDIWNGHASTTTTAFVQAGPGSTPALLLWGGGLAVHATQEWRGRQVLNPGDVITAESVDGDLRCAVSGYLLTAS